MCIRDRADRRGGSLHASVNKEIQDLAVTDDNLTIFDLDFNEEMAHMVFPPKRFDFDALYGQDSNPFLYFFYSPFVFSHPNTKLLLDDIQLDDSSSQLKSNHFGTIVLWHSATYINGSFPMRVDKTIWTDNTEHPYYFADTCRYEYRIRGETKFLIGILKKLGFKVIVYLVPRFFQDLERLGLQDLSTTMCWIKEFYQTNDIDGFYFDNAAYGPIKQNSWVETYWFVKQVRKTISPDAYLIHHDSIDAWGVTSGLRAIMINAYMNAQLAGETGVEAENITKATDPYFRFYSSGYGMSQAIGMHKVATKIQNDPTERQRLEQIVRCLMGGVLNGMERGLSTTDSNLFDSGFNDDFLDKYLERKRQYLLGGNNFKPLPANNCSEDGIPLPNDPPVTNA